MEKSNSNEQMPKLLNNITGLDTEIDKCLNIKKILVIANNTLLLTLWFVCGSILRLTFFSVLCIF